MSTQAIEEQIEQISLEIQRQKDVLKKLKSDKILLQQQLNALRDPVARLPLEISSDIFLRCLPPRSGYPEEYPRPKTHLAPLLFLNVCHHWTNIALSTPALWASIGIAFPCTSAFKNLLETWLRRAGSRLLHISLRGIFDSVVAHPIQSHSAQLESLVISFDQTDDLDDLEDESYDFLGGNHLHMELPRLRVLEIRGVGGVKCFWLSLHRLLRRAPNLTEIFIQNVSFLETINDEEPDSVVLPHLRQLTLYENFDGINWVSTPRLEILCLSTEHLFTESFISFLRQACPPLRKLELCGDSHSHNFEDSMALIPTLTHLDILCLESALAEALFGFLAQNPHHVPNLETMELDEVIIPRLASPNDVLTALASVLSVRRSRLKAVRLTICSSNKSLALPDDLTLFQEFLDDDGVDIEIALSDSPIDLSSDSEDES
ncbi:hypothetical protein FB45DRAFT_6032 [Roridomyces roridus]|uniref:F-box domain-containing protein n=1 Tax=Roridomyces roridus TaxID=1738132 RepID=A0AAD7FYF5_9AGAR|nr:hypothetical protein FB45DRAFT_6032 [Roridomyces roridus]